MARPCVSVKAAAGSGKVEATEEVLKLGTVAQGTLNGALHSAAFGGHLLVVQLLIKHSADVHKCLPI